ncbi:MAG: lytic murein transglycosylase [Candidatus Pacebacteria bacterium]|nr:lytic murein transglycosylase [Candidatus Paceibacterota bacterium]
MKKLLLILLIITLPIIGSAQSLSQSAEKKKAQLERELEQVEAEIREQQQIVNQAKQQTASIERDITILDAEIREAELKIRAKEVNIAQLGGDIIKKTETIGSLEDQISRGKESLRELLREKDRRNDDSLVEILLRHENLSDFFNEINSFDSINISLQDLFEDVRTAKSDTEIEREVLSERRAAEADAKKVIESERDTIRRLEQEKQKILGISKQTEAAYEAVLNERQRRAAEIRAALFSLRDSAAIPFGEALEYAEQAGRVTGVRPAFLLAILTQESNLGENVGTCNRPGDPESKKWYNIMPGPDDNSWRDDQTIFLQITKQLGLDPESVPLSCPWQGGWGGAMGPSQFIPTTWNSYSGRVSKALGKSVPSPWDPEDAFTASALYLADLGAAAGGYTAERTAALKYYAGGNWSKPQNAFYGDGVMGHATKIQSTIDELEGL